MKEYIEKYVTYYDIQKDTAILTTKTLKLTNWGYTTEYGTIYKCVYDTLEEARKELRKMTCNTMEIL